MKKILYIRIDNTPVPQVLKDIVEELDCRQINDFCSFVGYAITENLKNSDGTPYYRLIRPVGQLLMNFKTEDAGLFDAIISQWADILGNILHKGVSENDSYVIRFPQEYIDWLCQNEDLHYSYIGNNLKKNGSFVTLDAKGVEEDVISVLRFKIKRYLHSNQYEYIVFSNSRIENESDCIRRLYVSANFQFLKLEHLVDVYNKKHTEEPNTSTQEEHAEHCGHEYVDLGLPSSLKWATCNIGALEPFDYGDYYAWRQICKESSIRIRAFLGISGNPQYDVARAKWNGNWRIPTLKETRELVEQCIWKWEKLGNHYGYMVTGPNGNSIFLPAAGWRCHNTQGLAGRKGFYWAGQTGMYLLFSSSKYFVSMPDMAILYFACPIRAVLD